MSAPALDTRRTGASRSITGTLYFFGDLNGTLVKAGWTKAERPLLNRYREVQKELNTELRLLAAVRAPRTAETTLKARWVPYQDDSYRGHEEVYRAVPEVTEYVNWLRRQWWTTLELGDESDATVSPDSWLPTDTRRAAPPPSDPARLIQVERSFTGSLAGTVWDWMATPVPTVDGDYYTPYEIVWDGAGKAMGGIDLDAASHWLANRTLRVPDYFDLNRSAFEHPWFGRVWLNPPFGNNNPWFERILYFWERGEIEQVCMLSPTWAFITRIARRFMDARSAECLLAPTPKFWGNSANRTGRNDPHSVVYLGHRPREFCEAFVEFGHVSVRVEET